MASEDSESSSIFASSEKLRLVSSEGPSVFLISRHTMRVPHPLRMGPRETDLGLEDTNYADSAHSTISI